jgi:mannose-6-phosphate isomerase-like protein (cupin superfamily)
MNETDVATGFVTKRLGVEVDAVAPDGYDVRLLVNAQCGSCAVFELAPGQTGRAGALRTVTEIWVITSGRGRMWRRANGHEEIVDLEAGVSVSIPVGTQFQSQAIGYEPLAAVGVTIPAWPGGDEWYEVEGKWKPTVQPQPEAVK